MTQTPSNRMAKMSDKTKRAINKGRRKAGLKPIKFGATKKKSMLVRRYDADKLKKAYSVNGKTRWQIAKKKFKGDKIGLLQYYYNIPYALRKAYGAPKKMN